MMSDTNIAKFKVEDMECNHCVKTISDAINAQYPNASITIELAEHLVTVTGDTDKSKLLDIIKNEGYTPQAL